MTQADTVSTGSGELKQTLGLYSAMAIVAGSMIGSGIFIVSADIARQVQSGAWLLLIWVFTGLITVLGASAYGKLAAQMPKAGGQYVYLREAWGNIPGFLYGWALFWVIQTGTVAAVAVAFAKYLGVLFPIVSSAPLFWMGPFGVSSQQVVAVGLLLVLTAFHCTGVKNGALLQNCFTTLKVLALALLIGIGLFFGQKWLGLGVAGAAVSGASLQPIYPVSFWQVFATATVGALFSSDAWNNVTFIGSEIRQPHRNLPRALVLGTGLVVFLYVIVNIGYLNLLPLSVIQQAPEDRVATVAMNTVFGDQGAFWMALIILISTFGCLNGMLLAGARVFYAMAKDGLLFHQFATVDPRTQTPNVSLWAQGLWACLLALSGQYGQLLDFVIFTTLVFYVVTILGLFKLAKKQPEAYQMTRSWDYIAPCLYLIGVSYVAYFLLVSPEKSWTSVMGLLLTATGLPVYWLWQRIKTSRVSLQSSPGVL